MSSLIDREVVELVPVLVVAATRKTDANGGSKAGLEGKRMRAVSRTLD